MGVQHTLSPSVERETMVTKSRATVTQISGSRQSSTGSGTYDTSIKMEEQITRSFWTGWPLVQAALRNESGANYGAGARWIFTHRDWGAAFFTERSKITTDLSNLTVYSQKGRSAPWYAFDHSGPCLLGWRELPPAFTEAEISNAEQALWTLGAKAVRAARPNKPALDIPVLIGELRREGIPTLIGSIAGRSKTVRDVFASGGKEYLNVQFGWAPLVRDLVALLQLIPESRRRIEQYERDIDKLVRRRYHFPDQVEVTQGLTYGPTHAIYRPQANTPWGSMPLDNWRFDPYGQVPSQVNRIQSETWFSGGFRFYHRSVPEALTELSLLEEKANLLLGTRLDPEVLYNLSPWTWLLDWFVNFGDAIGNASALLSDDLVMQYGYLMKHTLQESTVSWPNLPYTRVSTGPLSGVWSQPENTHSLGNPAQGTYSTTISKETKQRGKASPFGFGLTPSDFTSDQWAILAALGISRV